MDQAVHTAQQKNTSTLETKKGVSIVGRHRLEVAVRTALPRSTSMAQGMANVGGVDQNRREVDVPTVQRRPMKNNLTQLLRRI